MWDLWEEKIEFVLKEKKELGEKEKEEILSLGKNIDYVWNHEKSDIENKRKKPKNGYPRSKLRGITPFFPSGRLFQFLTQQAAGNYTRTD
jgi:hypothetical protein